MARNLTLSSEKMELLIEEVKRRPCLWDRTHEDYKIRAWTKKKWLEVLDAMQLPHTLDKLIQVKWKNLKDVYVKKSRPNIAKNQRESWRYYNCLRFLDNPAVSKISESNSGEDSQTEETEVEQRHEESSSDDDEENKHNHNEHYPSKRNTVTYYNETDSEYDMMFLRSLAPYFRELEPVRKLVVRCKIQDVLLKEIAGQRGATQTMYADQSEDSTMIKAEPPI